MAYRRRSSYRRAHRRYHLSPFLATAPRQWRHAWSSELVQQSSVATGQVFVVKQWQVDQTQQAEVELLKDVQVALQIALSSTVSGQYVMAGRVFWYYIPRTTAIGSTAISKTDTRRIWRPQPWTVQAETSGSGSTFTTDLSYKRTYRFPKKQVGRDDSFGLAVQVDKVGGSSMTLRLLHAASWLEAEHG